MSPPEISEVITDSWLEDSFGFMTSAKLSSELAGWYSQLADMYHCYYLNAALYVKASDADSTMPAA